MIVNIAIYAIVSLELKKSPQFREKGVKSYVVFFLPETLREHSSGAGGVLLVTADFLLRGSLTPRPRGPGSAVDCGVREKVGLCGHLFIYYCVTPRSVWLVELRLGSDGSNVRVRLNEG